MQVLTPLHTGPNETAEADHRFDLHAILVSRFSDPKTIEGRGDDDPDGVIGEAEARADPAHNKYGESLMDMGEKVGKFIAGDTEECVDLLSNPRGTAPEVLRPGVSGERAWVSRRSPWVDLVGLSLREMG